MLKQELTIFCCFCLGVYCGSILHTYTHTHTHTHTPCFRRLTVCVDIYLIFIYFFEGIIYIHNAMDNFMVFSCWFSFSSRTAPLSSQTCAVSCDQLLIQLWYYTLHWSNRTCQPCCFECNSLRPTCLNCALRFWLFRKDLFFIVRKQTFVYLLAWLWHTFLFCK